ncbi:putative Lactose permease [Paramyrothecium foliicola]|nr:putative Lactose permease [Paramyrothecium foliicola]
MEKQMAEHHGGSLVGPTAPSEADMQRYTKHWWRHRNLRSLNLWMLIPLLSIFAQGFDGSMMNGLQSVSHWQTYFGTPRGATLGIFNAAYPLGGIAGVFFISPAADSVVVAGVGAPFITEIAHLAQRSTATALFLTFYSLVSITAGWTTFGTFRIDGDASWRIPSALQESPRWLVNTGRIEEALTILVTYHGEGDANDPVALFELSEITTTLQSEKELDSSKLLDFIATPGNRRRLIIKAWAAICSQMSGNAFVSYYLSPILSSVDLKSDLQQTLINATSQMVSWFSALYFATLPAKLGRRTLFLGSPVAMWAIVIAITAGSAEFAKDAYNFGFNGNLGLYNTEILPYRLRTLGLSVFYFIQFCFMILSNFAVPIGLHNIQWRLYPIFVAWIMVEFVGVWFLFPETKGPSLEEIAWIFDKPVIEQASDYPHDLEKSSLGDN